jgi:hypothetical protein
MAGWAAYRIQSARLPLMTAWKYRLAAVQVADKPGRPTGSDEDLLFGKSSSLRLLLD